MPSRRTYRRNAALAIKAAELAVAVPLVVAHRVNRMAVAKTPVSERDLKEFQLMGTEKAAAFMESWNAMAVHAIRANQALASSFLRACSAPLGPHSTQALATQMQNVALAMFGKGMAPLHRVAVANARRLARTPVR